MVRTSERLLRLLSLLQARAGWSGAELADRLGVTTRTVRNDVQRLRSLGYPVHASPGAGGGYRLGAGAALPPLLLDDDEAVAVAVGLRTAAAGSVTGIQETSVRALAKLEQVLPSRLRHRVDALHAATVEIPALGPTVDPELLTAIAGACRDHQRLRFDYRDHDGSATVRTSEPHRLVHDRGRWYLVAWDADRGGLAHLPRRPHPAPHPDRSAVRPPRATRRRRRDLPAAGGRVGDLAPPSPGAGARPGRGGRRAAPTRRPGRGGRRAHLHGRRRVRHPPDARRLPGDARRRLRHPRAPRARRGAAGAGRPVPPRNHGHGCLAQVSWLRQSTRCRSGALRRTWSWRILPTTTLAEVADATTQGIQRVCASDSLVVGFLAHTGLTLDP